MKHTQGKLTECPNCGSPISSTQNFCPQCGQENHDLNMPLRHLIEETAENIFHFDTKSVQTVKALLFRPGFLTLEFMKGRRASYVPPVRLYIFISFLFFLLLSLVMGRHPSTFDMSEMTTQSAEKKSSRLNIMFYNINSAELQGLRQPQIDSVMQAHSIEPSKLNKYIVHQLARIGATERSEFSYLLVKSISYMMFVLMPFFAFIVFIFYRKDARYYVGTLVFSIHYHSFAFLLLSFVALVSQMSGWSYVLILPLAVCPVYLFAAFKHVYRNSFFRTAVKFVAIGILQFVSMFALFLLTVFISILVF